MTMQWSPRWPPLEPLVVMGEGAAATALSMKLRDDPRLGTWSGVFADGVVVVMGADLPWVEGAEYFGKETAESWLLVPTAWTPDVPVSWLEHAFRKSSPRAGWPCVFTRGEVLVPLGNAGPIDRQQVLALTPTLFPDGEGGRQGG